MLCLVLYCLVFMYYCIVSICAYYKGHIIHGGYRVLGYIYIFSCNIHVYSYFDVLLYKSSFSPFKAGYYSHCDILQSVRLKTKQYFTKIYGTSYTLLLVIIIYIYYVRICSRCFYTLLF